MDISLILYFIHSFYYFFFFRLFVRQKFVSRFSFDFDGVSDGLFPSKICIFL